FDKAAALLAAKGRADVLSKLGDIGGLSIRNNVNSQTELSNHSFGFAADLDPTLNPNIKKDNIPLDLFVKLTGLDLYGAVNQRLRTPRAFDQCLADVVLFADASAAFVKAFASLQNLKPACGSFIAGSFGHSLDAARLDALFAAAGATPPDQLGARNVLAAAGFNAAQAAGAAKFAIAAAALFKASRQIAHPEVTGNDAQAARFGLINLPAPLIAALIASDGGKLSWLGTAQGPKDFMHFELFAADQPPLFSYPARRPRHT